MIGVEFGGWIYIIGGWLVGPMDGQTKGPREDFRDGKGYTGWGAKDEMIDT